MATHSRQHSNQPFSIERLVQRQTAKVLERGSRFSNFDRLRQRHFWSSYFFAPSTGVISAGPYDIFQVIPSGVGQGYPSSTPLSLLETNWRNSGRVPDNQNFVITEIGVTVKRPPQVVFGGGTALAAPSDGIYANLTTAQQAAINPAIPLNGIDVQTVLYGATLEMKYLTNTIPMGLLADFSQSAGTVSKNGSNTTGLSFGGDALNGIASPAFRRKLEIPILLQHGESMGMRINVPQPLNLLSVANGGAGWLEVRVDWFAYESFVEMS